MGDVGKSTKTFFIDGDWEIHDNPLRHLRLNPAVSRVVHYCKTDPYPHGKKQNCTVWATPAGNLDCPHCLETMPDSVQTLWTLQNFDVDFDHPQVVYGRIM